jgi:hypothetical protein
MNKRQRKKARKKLETILMEKLLIDTQRKLEIITQPEDFQDLIKVNPTMHFVMWGS